MSKKKVSHNPTTTRSRRTSESQITRAKDNYSEFSGHEAGYIDKYHLPNIKTGFKIGMCDGILYTTVRDGRTEKYIHKFKKTSRPVLASNHDGKFIFLLGGRYRFTERGIVDT